MTNIPAPLKPTDTESVLGYLANQSQRHERNVNDPNEWIYVNNEGPLADQPWAPIWQNGFFNVGLPRCLLRYRFLRPYDPDTSQNAVQLQGSVAGGSDGAVIFTIGIPLFNMTNPSVARTPETDLVPVTFDSDVYLTCTDDAGDLKIITVKTTGDVVFGFV